MKNAFTLNYLEKGLIAQSNIESMRDDDGDLLLSDKPNYLW